MKAILRWGIGLFGLLLLCSVSHAQGRYWATPVTKCPYPQVPGICGSGYYLMDAYGNWSGPYYYVYPPMPPHQGFLPGPVGQAIASGNLPHTLLMSKQGMNIGNMPLIQEPKKNNIFSFGGQHGEPQAPSAPHMPVMVGSAPMGPMQTPYGMPPAQMAGMQPYGMQTPYGMPPAQMAGMPPYGMPMPNAYPGMAPGQLMSHHHGSHRSPFSPIPTFTPMTPMTPMPPLNPNMTPLQMPRMDFVPPPSAPPPGGGAFPTHPFVRSPRDFFMWGENMEDEARMRNRPFPVPR